MAKTYAGCARLFACWARAAAIPRSGFSRFGRRRSFADVFAGRDEILHHLILPPYLPLPGECLRVGDYHIALHHIGIDLEDLPFL